MIAIVCIDDNKGMMFNNRRQSKDSVVRENILQVASSSKLWLNEYSSNQFEQTVLPLLAVDEYFLEKAVAGEYVFVENLALSHYIDKLEQIIIYRWNKKYPSDFHLDIDVNTPNWKLISSEDFVGSSHEKITKDIYDKAD